MKHRLVRKLIVCKILPMLTTDHSPVDTDQPDEDPFEAEEGLEEEREPTERATDEIEAPFDPDSIRIRNFSLPVSTMLDRIHEGDTDLQPSFQRRLGIWTHGKKSRLVESLLLRIPIPVFYAAADELDRWSVVDGIQRLSTLDGYVENEYPLRGLQYLQAYEGKLFHELPRHFQRRITETQLVVNVIEHGTPEDVMFNIFLRINTGGTPLSAQEIRHAINPGPARGFLRDVAESDEFLEATTWSVNQRRMADRELVLRFMAFYSAGVGNYTTGNMDAFLSDAMRRLNSLGDDERDALKQVFFKAMHASRRLFGDYAFRKPRRKGGNRRPINRALFETLSLHLALRTPEEIEQLIGRKSEVLSRFEDLFTDWEFEAAISWATGSVDRVERRFAAVGNLISEFTTC